MWNLILLREIPVFMGMMYGLKCTSECFLPQVWVNLSFNLSLIT